MIAKLISKIKKNDSYAIESSYSNYEWFVILSERTTQLIRGLWGKLWLIKAKGLFFRGKGVRVKQRKLFSAGRNLILEDGVYINALSEKGIRFGDNVTIAKKSTLICTGVIAQKGTGISIGDNSAVNAYSFLGGQGGIRIGNGVIMGPHVKIFSENHVFDDASKLIKDQGVTRKGVVIGDDCWIGAGVSILDGVTLENRTIVAAGSVVTKSFPGNCVLGGVPAKVLKNL
ncbi:acyltransferase [Flagellimonas sp. DF-77]|uniref:acyltransferase n=1 Tax=Flagellimonas algarum TaxID=3230298 RepID=UPI00339262A9